MREISVDWLGLETARWRAVLVQKPIFHPSGVRLHSPGEALVPEDVERMKRLGMKTLFILEPGETEFKAVGGLGVERLEPRALAAGDVLAEDLTGADGGVLAFSGQVLDATLVARAAGARASTVAIRRRGLEEAQRQARDYLAQRPPVPPRGARADERVTEFIRAALIQVRPLLVPQARVAVGVREEFARAVVHNTLAGAGYEVVAWTPSVSGIEELRSRRPDLLVVELEDAQDLGRALRKGEGLGEMGILACVEDGRRAEAAGALLDGANDTVHRPPPPDLLLYKVRVCLQVMGRRVDLAPAVLMDRRRRPRPPVAMRGTVRDRASSGPLPVSAVEVTELTDGGARIAYSRPERFPRHALLPHGVHPRHFFYEFARSNPKGLDLVLAWDPPGGGRRERPARVVHVEGAGDRETAGLAFPPDRPA